MKRESETSDTGLGTTIPWRNVPHSQIPKGTVISGSTHYLSFSGETSRFLGRAEVLTYHCPR